MKLRNLIIPAIIVAAVGYMSLTRHTYNIDKATEYLTIHKESKSVGACARYVRLAIEAGGCPTYFYPHNANGYFKFLPALGFTEIDKQNYTPRKGDVIVIESEKHGHIAMYNGKVWISDFQQRDRWGWKKYRKPGVRYALFRKANGKGKRQLIP